MSRSTARWCGVVAATVLSGSTLAAAPASADDAIAVPDLPPLPVLPQLGLSPLPSLAGVPADGLWPTEVDTGNLTDGPFDDIVVANEAGTSVTVLRANPAGGYHPPERIDVGLLPSNVHIHDMNDDARDDIVVMDAGGNTISVLLNEGGGTFGKAVRSQTDTLATAALTIDDFNGDGHEDTAVSHPGGSVAVNFGNGDGTFGPPTSLAGPLGGIGVTSGDYDNDGDADIASVGAASPTQTILLNNGDGTFRHTSAPVGIGGICNRTADLDGNGTADLISSHVDGRITVLRGHGDGTFAEAAHYPSKILWASCFGVGDYDADGDEDLATANMAGFSMSVLHNNGDGTLGEAQVRSAGDWIITCTAGRINDDAALDVLCPGGVVPVLVAFDGKGDGSFGPARRIPLG